MKGCYFVRDIKMKPPDCFLDMGFEGGLTPVEFYEKPDCDGYRLSDCCNAPVNRDILICCECKEHCGTMCDDCDEECENRKNSY